MKYWIVGEVEEVRKRHDQKIMSGEAFTMNNKSLGGCIKRPINDDGKIYVLTPLSEVCRVYNLNESIFLTDDAIDILLGLQKTLGSSCYPIIEIDEDG
jgi:hypothetical protein